MEMTGMVREMSGLTVPVTWMEEAAA